MVFWPLLSCVISTRYDSASAASRHSKAILLVTSLTKLPSVQSKFWVGKTKDIGPGGLGGASFPQPSSTRRTQKRVTYTVRASFVFQPNAVPSKFRSKLATTSCPVSSACHICGAIIVPGPASGWQMQRQAPVITIL